MVKRKLSLQLILSPFISQLGSAIYLLGLNWLIVKATGDTKLIGWITGVGGIMFVVGDVLGASIVDHHDRKWVLVLSDAVSAVACLGGAWLITPAQPQIWLLILLTSVLDLMVSINFPAAKAITPDVIAASALQRFNAIANTVFNLANIVAPLLGGVLLAGGFLNFKGFLLVNASSFVLAGLLNWSLKTPPFTPTDTHSHLIGDTVSGLRFVFGDKRLSLMMIALGAYNFCAAGYLLAAPYIAAHQFHGHATAYSNFLLITAIGGLLGGTALSLQRRGVSAMQVYLEQLVVAVLLVGLGCHLTHPLWLGMAFVNGFVNAQMFSSLATLMQGLTPRELLGRVFGLTFLVFDGAQPLGNFFFGQFIKAWGAQTYTVLGGLLVVSFGVIIAITKRQERGGA